MLEEFKRLKIWVEKCPVEAAMRIEDLERKQNDYTETLNETRRSRDKAKGKLEVALKEIKLRKKYESFLRSVIRSGETLSEKETYEYFCKKFNS